MAAIVLVKSSPYAGSSSPWVVQAWTTTPVAFDCLLNGPSGYAGQQWGHACRRITVMGTGGTLIYTDPFGNVRTLTCVTGEVLDIEAAALSGSSTAQGVKVYW